MSACPNCRQEVADTSNACALCGFSLMKPCPMCAELIRVQAIKCKFCHARLDQPAGAAAPPSALSSEAKKLEGDAQMAMIFGILGIAICAIFAPFAWYKGAQVNARLRQLGLPKNSNATAGVILGIIQCALLGMALCIVMLALVAGALGR